VQALKTGANLQADFRNQRQDTNSVFSSFNPSYQSSFFVNLSQPLFRGLKIDAGRQQLRVSKNNREISDVAFRQTVINTLANTKTLYFDLIAAIDNLEAQRKSLELAQKLLSENEIKVRVGTLAPLDVVEAESEVASREEGVIVAENQLAEAEDALKLAIFPEHDAATWSLRIVPTDRPSTERVDVDVDAAIAKALEQRTDVVSARKRLQNSEYTLEYAGDLTKPAIDLVAGVGSVGVGGTFLVREGLGGEVTQTIPGGYSDALGDVFGLENPDWSVGVQVSIPLQNRSARAQKARAQIALDQARTSLTRLEMLVAQAVRTAGRAVETNYKRVGTTQAAQVLQDRRLDAEQKKFAAGMSTSFLVTQAQRDLALAEVAALRAAADYRKSIVDFERVQEAGLGTGSGSITVTSN
jgi:outer membrane protein TolC